MNPVSGAGELEQVEGPLLMNRARKYSSAEALRFGLANTLKHPAYGRDVGLFSEIGLPNIGLVATRFGESACCYEAPASLAGYEW
jgi:hypothetical protein